MIIAASAALGSSKLSAAAGVSTNGWTRGTRSSCGLGATLVGRGAEAGLASQLVSIGGAAGYTCAINGGRAVEGGMWQASARWHPLLWSVAGREGAELQEGRGLLGALIGGTSFGGLRMWKGISGRGIGRMVWCGDLGGNMIGFGSSWLGRSIVGVGGGTGPMHQDGTRFGVLMGLVMVALAGGNGEQAECTYNKELPNDSTTRIDWVMNGAPCKDGVAPTPLEFEVFFNEQVGVKVAGLPAITPIRDVRQTQCFGFVTTVGISDALHLLAGEGMVFDWQKKDGTSSEMAEIISSTVQLMEYRPRDNNYMSAGVKVHGMANVDKQQVEVWVQETLANHNGGSIEELFRAELAPYNTNRSGLQGRVWNIFFKNQDMVRRFNWRAKFAGVEVKDSKGEVVHNYETTMPFMRPDGEDGHTRKLYLGGVGNTDNKELALCLVRQSEYIDKFALEAWVMMNRDGTSRNFGFLTMMAAENAQHVRAGPTLVNPSQVAMRVVEALPIPAPVEQSGTLPRSSYGNMKRNPAFVSGYGVAPLSGFNEGYMLDVCGRAFKKMMDSEYRHLANPQAMRLEMEGAITNKKGLFVEIARETNKELMDNFRQYMSGVHEALGRVGMLLAAKYGINVMEMERRWPGAGRKRGLEVMNDHIESMLTSTPPDDNVPFPAMPEEGFNNDNSQSFLNQLVHNRQGQELLRQFQQFNNSGGQDGSGGRRHDTHNHR